MQLVLTTPGSYLHVKEGCFSVRTGEQEIQVAQGKVQSIVLTTVVSLSTEAVRLAVENNIDIVFLDKFGQPYGRVWQSRMGSTARIRRRQLAAAEQPLGLQLVQEWTLTKLGNQEDFLKRLAHSRPRREEEAQAFVRNVSQSAAKIRHLSGSLADVSDTIRGLEGSAGRAYFRGLSFLLPQKWQFKKRSYSPAEDGFNCMLNYCYGVMYSLVERACVLAGLDPHVGFLHTDNYGKRSLVYDVIEPFRLWPEETAFFLFSGRKVEEDFFDDVPGGLTLNKDGKKLLISSLNERLDGSVRYRRRNIKRRDIIQAECHRTANRLLNAPNPEEVPDVKEV